MYYSVYIIINIIGCKKVYCLNDSVGTETVFCHRKYFCIFATLSVTVNHNFKRGKEISTTHQTSTQHGFPNIVLKRKLVGVYWMPLWNDSTEYLLTFLSLLNSRLQTTRLQLKQRILFTNQKSSRESSTIVDT